jgi:tetratricopeptide (TPR) repeat protein
MRGSAKSADPWFGYSGLSILAWTLLCALCLPSKAPAAPLPAAVASRLLAEGLDHFYNLEYDQAIPIFERLRADDPRNPNWQNHAALGYFYKQLYIAGALEGDLFGASNKFFRTRKIKPDAVLEYQFRQANEAAVRICGQRLKEDSRDEEALYACGVAYAARATHQGLIERSVLDSLGSARRANDYHTRLARVNPRFYDAYLIPGLYDFVLGSLPGPVKVLFFFAGLNGDKQRGIGLVEKVVQWGDGARHDARILLTVMYRRERRFADARRTIEALAGAFPRNYVLPLEIASLHRAAQETPDAIREYERVLERVRAGVPNYSEAPAARIHFELGVLYQMDQNLEAALQHIRQVAGSRGSTPDLAAESARIQQQLEAALQQQGAQAASHPSAP